MRKMKKIRGGVTRQYFLAKILIFFGGGNISHNNCFQFRVMTLTRGAPANKFYFPVGRGSGNIKLYAFVVKLGTNLTV